MNKPEFYHISYHTHRNLYTDGPMIGGFYNWVLAFRAGGCQSEFIAEQNFYRYRDSADIVFVGVSPLENKGHILYKTRRKLTNKKTKIVACVDYSPELWPFGFNLDSLISELDQCDHIFAAERSMVSRIQAAMPWRHVHYLPHPTNTDAIKKRIAPVPLDEREAQIFYIIHRYDNNMNDMKCVSDGIPKEQYGYDNIAICMDHQIYLDCLSMFDRAYQGEQFGGFIQKLSKIRVAVDSYHKIHSYGRVPVECACLKTPIVSTNWVTSALNLWPECTISAGDVKAQQDMVKRLLEDDEFHNKVTEYAYREVEQYNYQNSVNAFMHMINSGKN